MRETNVVMIAPCGLYHVSDEVCTTLPACLVAGLNVDAGIPREGIVGLLFPSFACVLGCLAPILVLLLPPVLSLQLLLLPLLLGPSVWSLVLSNTLYALAFSVYFYITHLGYRCENRKPPPMEIATKSTCRSGGARAEGFPAGGGCGRRNFNIFSLSFDVFFEVDVEAFLIIVSRVSPQQ